MGCGQVRTAGERIAKAPSSPVRRWLDSGAACCIGAGRRLGQSRGTEGRASDSNRVEWIGREGLREERASLQPMAMERMGQDCKGAEGTGNGPNQVTLVGAVVCCAPKQPASRRLECS